MKTCTEAPVNFILYFFYCGYFGGKLHSGERNWGKNCQTNDQNLNKFVICGKHCGGNYH